MRLRHTLMNALDNTNTIQYKTYNAPYVTEMLFVGMTRSAQMYWLTRHMYKDSSIFFLLTTSTNVLIHNC